MTKVLIAFDGHHFSDGAFQFVRHLNQQQPVLAIGVFLPTIDYVELLYSFGGVITGPLYYQDIALDDMAIVQENIDRFKLACAQNGLEYRVHPDIEKHVITEVKTESRFADLLVIGSEFFYENLGSDVQEDYIENVLHKSECPVILVPEHYAFPENVILAYDGSEYSVYAIKQFAYLFPAFTKLKTLLVYAGESEIPDAKYIEELGSAHFYYLSIYPLEINSKKYFNTWLEDHGNSILVAGAYGRSALSEILKKSFITDAIKDHKVPIFIAHK